MVKSEYQALKAALEWHIDENADFALADEPLGLMNARGGALPAAPLSESVKSSGIPLPSAAPVNPPLGASEARAEAIRLAMAATDLDGLKQAIADFDGIGLRDTATNLVFADGNPGAAIMLIGDAPGADDDRSGLPFAPGMQGDLLDRMMAAVGLDRKQDDPKQSLYISHVLNWRPPGGRSPLPGEIEVSLPFIERHIQLVKPQILLFSGGVAAKALLGESLSISKLRGKWHAYSPQTPELKTGAGEPIPALALFDPAYIIQNPAQKRPLWSDLLGLLEKRRTLGLIE